MESTSEITGGAQVKLPQVGKATDQAGSAATMGAQHHQQQGILTSVWTFIRHYLEMCLAMCVGGITLNVLFFGAAALIGYPDLIGRFPELSILIIAINLSIPMIAWMRFRGHEWRPTLEMASTTIVLGILLISLAWFNILPTSSMLEWLKRLACPVMLVPMLLRLDLYTKHHTSHQHQAHAAHAGR